MKTFNRWRKVRALVFQSKSEGVDEEMAKDTTVSVQIRSLAIVNQDHFKKIDFSNVFFLVRNASFKALHEKVLRRIE